jgi:hypothetical protein
MERNLLHPDSIPTDLQARLRTKGDQLKLKRFTAKKVDSLFKRIDDHFGLSPFQEIRQRSKSWFEQNQETLKEVSDFAESVGLVFTPDESGRLSYACFEEMQKNELSSAAERKDQLSGGKNKKYIKIWQKLQKKVDKYLVKGADGDAATDPKALDIILGFLKSLLDREDKSKLSLEIVDKYIDDIAKIAEINDYFGIPPGKSKLTSFAHSNAWWVFEEIMHDPRFRHDIFMAEAGEIGYKRKAGNRYDLNRANDLFYCSDPERIAETIEPDRVGTLLAKLRAHWKKKGNNSSKPDLPGGFKTTTTKIGGQIFLRADPKYRFFWDIQNGQTLDTRDQIQVRLESILLPLGKRIFGKGRLAEERCIIELDDVEARTSIILPDEQGNRHTVTEIGSSKLDFRDCDLIFNRLEPYLGKILVNQASERWIGTTEWIPLKLRRDLADPYFLKYLLLSKEFLNHEQRGSYWKLRAGKRHARLTDWDLRKLLIPLPTIERQLEAAQHIRVLEENMIKHHRSLRTRPEVIEDIFVEEFGYSLSEYETKANQHENNTNGGRLTTALDLRSGVRFQHPKYDAVYSILSSSAPLFYQRSITITKARLISLVPQ